MTKRKKPAAEPVSPPPPTAAGPAPLVAPPLPSVGAGGATPAADPADAPRPAAFAVRADYAAGVTLLEDRKFRQVQIRFADKPPEAVRTLVREAGFQWRANEGVWSKQLDPDHGWRTRADAERLYDRVADMLRDGPAVG